MTKITLTNDFHGTSVNLMVDVNDDGDAKLSARQIKRARSALCIKGCGCSGYVGHRGYQHDVTEIEPITDWQTGDIRHAWIHLRGY